MNKQNLSKTIIAFFSSLAIIASVIYLIYEPKTTTETAPEFKDEPKMASVTVVAAFPASEVAAVEAPAAQTTAGTDIESKDNANTAPVTVTAASPASEVAAAVTPAAQSTAGMDLESKDKPKTVSVTVAAASRASEVAAVEAPAARTTAGAALEPKDKAKTAPVTEAPASKATASISSAKASADVAPTPIVAEITAAPRTANSFNRLFRAPAKLNLPPSEDGIHDSASKGTRMLQTPLEAFAALPKSRKGNRVDWVNALDNKQIKPRADRLDPNAEMKIWDVQNVMPVKNSMPDVVFSHKIHTQWLACSNCHPDIYAEKTGGNQGNMAAFSRGRGCGICHNKVAFPLSECRKCHSRNKPAQAKASTKP